MKPKRDFKGLDIPLVNGWKLKSDTYNIILTNEEGRNFYYSNIQSAVETLIDKEIKRFDCTTIAELLTAIKTLSINLNKAIEPLNLRVVNENQIKTKQETL